MNVSYSLKEIHKRQYYNQANIVYLSTFFACFIFIPIFVIIGHPWLIGLCVLTFLSSIFALKLNQHERYGLASFVFISSITLQTFVEVIFFGLVSGFAYYFFNMTGLIIYTSWSNRQKVIGVSIETSLFMIAFFYHIFYSPVVDLSQGLTIFFHITNIIFNIVGVGHSAFYYVRIAHGSQIHLSKLALIDHLTELPNRTAIAQYFDQINPIDDWLNQDIALLMIDIDHFKDINDSYGHMTGDSVLKELGQILQLTKRTSDFLARYGGEEFMMIIGVDSMFKLHEIAEGYRRKIENHVFKVGDLSLQLTISIGGLYKPSQMFLNYQEGIEKADALLYQAKQSGRNRVALHQK